jgi:hypothetical protein
MANRMVAALFAVMFTALTYLSLSAAVSAQSLDTPAADFTASGCMSTPSGLFRSLI